MKIILLILTLATSVPVLAQNNPQDISDWGTAIGKARICKMGASRIENIEKRARNEMVRRAKTKKEVAAAVNLFERSISLGEQQQLEFKYDCRAVERTLKSIENSGW